MSYRTVVVLATWESCEAGRDRQGFTQYETIGVRPQDPAPPAEPAQNGRWRLVNAQLLVIEGAPSCWIFFWEDSLA